MTRNTVPRPGVHRPVALAFSLVARSNPLGRQVDSPSPTRLLWPLLLVALFATACGGAAAVPDEGPYAGVELEIPLEKPDITLIDTDGEPWSLREETEGALTLLYFGYTNCPDVCPIHLAQLDAVLSRPGMPRNVEVVLVTIDPARDDEATLRRFLDQFDDDYIGLTGTLDEVQQAQIDFGLAVAVEEEPGVFGHGTQVFAFAPDGYAYTVYPQGTRQSHWIDDLPLLDELDGDPT